MIGDFKEVNASCFDLALKARKDERYNDCLSILKEVSNNNDANCVYLLAQCYYGGFYEVRQDYTEAFELFRKNINHFKSNKSTFN